MSDRDSGPLAVKKWRDKYLDLIDQHELLEQNSEQQQSQLRKALVMVSLLAEGQAETIDQPLLKLREAIKPKNKLVKIESLLDQLKTAVNKFEQNRELQAEKIVDQLHNAAEQLLKLPLSSEEKSQIKKVRSGARKQLLQWSGYAEQLQQWGKILANIELNDDAVSEMQAQAQSEGFLSRLFKRSEPSETENKTSDEPDDEPLVRNESLEQLTDSPSLAQSEHGQIEHGDYNNQQLDIEQLVNEASDTLKTILAQLIIPSRLHPLCDQLQKKLDQPLNWQELIPLLQQIGDLIIQSLSTGQQDFEHFLQGLNEQLETIQDLLDLTSSQQSEKRIASTQFDNEIKNQVDEIHSLVAGHEQLGSLGSSIQQHLNSILGSMEQYREQEQSREQELTEQLKGMQLQLAEMEKTAQEAQATIEEHRYKAMHDKLTGLPNREAYEQRLHQEILRLQRYQNPLTLLVCDIDKFKNINDTYGHQAGDRVLQLIAKSIQKHIRDVDFVARFGGEEFVILMPETTSQQAFNAAEKLREVIAGAPFSFRKQPVQVTISIGISQFGEKEMESTVFERADKALYQAKEGGRNMCVINDLEQT